jgi:biotin-dependent carboxylase-like uncharacterized protein
MGAGSATLEILDPGLLLSVQDGGRPGLAREGVPRGGAADRRSLAIANLLVGNAPDAAALEATVLGPRVRALRPITIGLAGTMGARVRDMPLPIEPGATVTLAVGDVLELEPATGARGYLALPGGLDVPAVLGSRSTALGAGFGGFGGRALRAGDRLSAVDPNRVLAPGRWPGRAAPGPVDAANPLRVVPGPDARDLGPTALEALVRTAWSVSPTSDRVGLRLDGSPIRRGHALELPSHGVVEGAVQLPPDGQPIILHVDHQPTGGYPVVAVVITADLARVGQLAPGADVRFEVTDAAGARAVLSTANHAFDRARSELGDAARWDDLWRDAGA